MSGSSERIFNGIEWGTWVKRRRKQLGFTQKQFALLMHYSPEMISHLERGVNRPSAEQLSRIAAALDVPAAERLEFIRVGRLEPGGATTPTAPSPGASLPALAATPLVGRATDLANIEKLLERPSSRLVTITGLAGVGKTRLARAVAQVAQERGTHAVFWVALVGIREASLALAAATQALGLEGAGSASLSAALQSRFTTQRVLLILDNCEQVANINQVIAPLLVAPGLQILATSRKRLNLRGERLAPLDPLALPADATRLTLDELLDYPALALFAERVRETNPRLEITTENAPTFIRICAALGGLPLALELAASRVGVLPVEAMLQRMDQSLSWLNGGAVDQPEQQTLLGTLDLTYNLLSSEEQLLFRRLAVFAGGFTLDAVETILGYSSQAHSDTLALIAGLHEWSLIYLSAMQATAPRYALLEIIHEYAERKLDPADAALLKQAHLQFYLRFAEQAGSPEQRPQLAENQRWLEQEQGNIRAALEWAMSTADQLQVAARFCLALEWFWEIRGLWSEAAYWLSHLLAQESGLADELLARLRYSAGRFAYLRGEYGAARDLLTRSLEQGQRLGDYGIQIKALNNLGWIAYSQSDYRRARQYYEASMPLCRKQNDPVTLATTLNILGTIEATMGYTAVAEKLLQESLELRQAQNDQRGIARSLNSLALAALYTDKPEQALRLSRDSSKLFQSVGDELGIALATINLGWALFAQGQNAQAQSVLLGALEQTKSVGSVWSQSLALCYLGWVALDQGETEQAQRLLEESLALSQQQESVDIMSLAELGQAQLAAAANDPEQVALHLQKADALIDQSGIMLPPWERRLVDQLRQALA